MKELLILRHVSLVISIPPLSPPQTHSAEIILLFPYLLPHPFLISFLNPNPHSNFNHRHRLTRPPVVATTTLIFTATFFVHNLPARRIETDLPKNPWNQIGPRSFTAQTTSNDHKTTNNEIRTPENLGSGSFPAIRSPFTPRTASPPTAPSIWRLPGLRSEFICRIHDHRVEKSRIDTFCDSKGHCRPLINVVGRRP